MTDSELAEIDRKSRCYSISDKDLAHLITSLRESRARIAKLERELESLSLSRFTRSLQRDEAEARIAELEAAIERAKALHFPHSSAKPTICYECGDLVPCPTLAALATPPEATDPSTESRLQ
jgi:DNA-binding transcriptional MerR regulator